MQTISFTQLRTEPKRLKNSLQRGESLHLTHRSKVLAEIKPQQDKVKVFDAQKFLKITRKLNLPQLSPKQLERNYREHMISKYGRGLSGR